MLAPNGPTYVVNVGTEWAYARACHPKARACRGVSVPLPRLLSRQHCSVRRSQDLAGAMKRVIRPNTVICTAAFLLASCGGNDPTGPGLGLFTAAVDGDVDVSLRGDAVFFEGGSIIWMLDGNFNGHHDFLRLDRDPSAGPPGVGTCVKALNAWQRSRNRKAHLRPTLVPKTPKGPKPWGLSAWRRGELNPGPSLDPTARLRA